ncbi:hypothetical protein M231_06805 [Tremella mesenterica]|uniref:Uncharacterized protein n=1 Tax=Tremella mesenterica TaxID=5217 RepID=A0A4Q1BAV8_TREME|nr:hypothetical protein M231_06805 [Tremella mesenterica]
MRSDTSRNTTTQRRPGRKSTLTQDQTDKWLLTNGFSVQLEAQRDFSPALASNRLQLSALAIGYITTKAVNYPWAAAEVLRVREMEKELHEGIINMTRVSQQI